MGDSTAMTIEFLRARLLSERSVSRTAKQRADQLSKKVMELEEQLRIVTVQRKKAEKAAVEVLAILESQGIGDFSEVVDSSSEQDEDPRGLKGSDDTLKEDVISTASRTERSEVEDGLSASELEVSPSQGRSLSWKSHSSSPDSIRKQKVSQARQRQRRSSFISAVGSSPKHHLGKSCRKIRQREIGSAAEDESDHGKRETAQSNHSDDQPDLYREVSSGNETENVSPCTRSLDNHNKETDSGLYANGSHRDEEMERVLEQQAQLIDQFQAEENAQREWEDKYNESKSSTPDPCRPGNQPDIAENSTAPEESTELADKVPYSNKAENISCIADLPAQTLSNVFVPTHHPFRGTNPEKNDSSKEATAIAFSNGYVPNDPTSTHSGSSFHAGKDGLLDQQYNIMAASEIGTGSREFAFPAQGSSDTTTNGKQNKGLLYDNSDMSSRSNSSFIPNGHGFLMSPSTESPSSVHSGSKFSNGGPLAIQNQPHRTPPQSPSSSSSLGGVLEALQRAKLSLRKELSRFPSPSQSNLAITVPTDSQVQAIKSGDSLGIPIGSAGLFRLPTDSFPQASYSGPKYYDSGLSLTANRSDVGYAINANAYKYPTTSYVEAGSRVSVGNQHFDRFVDSGMGMPSSSSRYSLPYSDVTTERNPFHDGFRKPDMDMRNEMPAGDRYSLYGGDWTRYDVRRL